MTDRTSYARSIEALTERRDALVARLAASKRYKGRAADVRELVAVEDDLDDALAAEQAAVEAAAEQAEYDAWEANDIAATNATDAARTEAFRSRVATRSYFMWLNGEGSSDEARWLEAEAFERSAAIQAARDASDVRYFGEWRTPHDVECETRMVGLH